MTSRPVRVFVAGEKELDPLDIYYTHAKIRPFFSGCGRPISETIADLESRKITADDLPKVSVIQDNDGNYFCLNNRRLYVLKHARQKGLLEDDKIVVRLKKAIPRELAKYSKEKCSLKGTIIREKAALQLTAKSDTQEAKGSNDSSNPPPTEKSPDPSADLPKDSIPIRQDVRTKNDKKKFQSCAEETDEERFLRQKQKIAEAQEQYKRQAEERRKQKLAKEAAKRSSENQQEDEEHVSSSDEEEQLMTDVFICNLCSKEFKSVEQIEQHFKSKSHRKLVQEEFKKKKEKEKKAAKKAAAKQRKKKTSESQQAEIDLDETNLKPVPPIPPANESAPDDCSDHEDKNCPVEVDECPEDNSSPESDDDDDDDDDMLLSLASNTMKCQLGLPTDDPDSDDA